MSVQCIFQTFIVVAVSQKLGCHANNGIHFQPTCHECVTLLSTYFDGVWHTFTAIDESDTITYPDIGRNLGKGQ